MDSDIRAISALQIQCDDLSEKVDHILDLYQKSLDLEFHFKDLQYRLGALDKVMDEFKIFMTTYTWHKGS